MVELSFISSDVEQYWSNKSLLSSCSWPVSHHAENCYEYVTHSGTSYARVGEDNGATCNERPYSFMSRRWQEIKGRCDLHSEVIFLALQYT